MSIKTILRNVIASGFVVGTFAALSPAAFAATSNDTQSGTVAPIGTVSYTAGPSLTITPNVDQTDTDFGSVNVQSNSNAGWTLEVASANGSMLKNTGVTPVATISYTLKVGGTSVDVSTAGTAVTAKDVSVLTDSADGGHDYAVQGTIAAAASDGRPSGTYEDTLTFTLTNK